MEKRRRIFAALDFLVQKIDMNDKLRMLFNDTVVYGATTIVGRFLTFLLTPFYTNYLATQADYGEIATVYSIIAFVNILFSFGLDAALLRFYDNKDIQKTQEVFSNVFWSIVLISGLFTLIMFTVSESIAPLFFSHDPTGSLTRLGLAIPFFDALTVAPFALLRMKRKSRHFALTKLAVIVVNVAANVLFVAGWNMGVEGVLMAGAISSAFAVAALFPEIMRNLQLKMSISLLREMLVFGLPTVPAAFSAIVLQIIDRPIMKFLSDASTVGLYQANYRLGIPMMLFVSIFETAWKPFYLSHADDAEDPRPLYSRVMTIFCMVCGGIFLAGAFFIEYIVGMPFFGGKLIHPRYWSGLGIVPIILGGYVFNGMMTNFSAGFHIMKQTQYLAIAMGIAAGVNVALNLLLIPSLGIYGAAYATLAAYMVGAAFLYRFSQLIYRIDYQWKTIFAILSSSVALEAIVLLIQPHWFIRLCLLAAWGGAVLFFSEKKSIQLILRMAKKSNRRAR